MKRIFFLLFFFIGGAVITAQNHKEYDSNGKLSASGEMNGSRRIGKWETYHDNGQISAKGYYNEDGYPKKDTWETFNRNGEKNGCNCPEPTADQFAAVCSDNFYGYESKLSGTGLTYAYQEKLWKMSCAEPGVDNFETAIPKVQCMWNKYKEKFRCYNYPNSIATDRNITKFTMDMGFDAFLIEMSRKYKGDLNFIDPKDGKTILDFLKEQMELIRRTPPVNFEKADDYERTYNMIKKNGAKHSWELNKN